MSPIGAKIMFTSPTGPRGRGLETSQARLQRVRELKLEKELETKSMSFFELVQLLELFLIS